MFTAALYVLGALITVGNTVLSLRAHKASRGAIIQAAISQAMGQVPNLIKAGVITPNAALSHFLAIVATVASSHNVNLSPREIQQAQDALEAVVKQ